MKYRINRRLWLKIHAIFKVFFAYHLSLHHLSFLFPALSILLQYLRFCDNGGRRGSARFLAQYVWDEGEDCSGWEGYQVWVQGRGLEEQESSAFRDEPHSQEDPSSHPQRKTDVWVPHHCSVHRWGLEGQVSIAAHWSLPESSFQVLGGFCW